MKKLWYILPGLCFLASWSVAETIESVTFNPARLGRYESLKVSDNLTTKGGINAQSVTVQSAGTVDIDNSGNYQADSVDVMGKISMPSTRFVTPNLESKGTASFVNKSSSASSEIADLNAAVRLKANVLKLGTTVVSGASAIDYDGDSASGLTLGNNKIPVPASSCTNLQWVSRVADDGNAYKVLAFGSCGAEEEDDCTTLYGPWRPGLATMRDTCNGDSVNPFSCTDAPRNQTTSCIDVSGGGQTSGGTSVSEGSVTEVTSTTEDTCNGDRISKYTGTPYASCVDVYADASLSVLREGQLSPANCRYGCVYNAPSALGTEFEVAQRYGIQTFCLRYVANSYPSCAGCLNRLEAGALKYPYTCIVRYYARQLSATTSSGATHRLVRCCGNETSGGTDQGTGEVSYGGGGGGIADDDTNEDQLYHTWIDPKEEYKPLP